MNVFLSTLSAARCNLEAFLKDSSSGTKKLVLGATSLLLLLGVKSLRWRYRKRIEGGLTKKAILITGCDSGFGYSLAMHCLQDTDIGLVIAACHKPKNPDSGANNLIGACDANNKGRLKVMELDVTKDESVQKLKQDVELTLDDSDCDLWCVVNNAAVLTFGESEWQPTDLVAHQFDVNVFGVHRVTKAFLPELRKCKGRVVNMISFCTFLPMPMLGVYTATKAALLNLTHGERMEQKKFGVDVILFNPGDHPGETPLCANQTAYYSQMEREVAQIKDFTMFEPYFNRSRNYFTSLFKLPPVNKLNNPGYYKTMDEILTVANPEPIYVNSDYLTTAFFSFMSWLPCRWADVASVKLMRLPNLNEEYKPL